MTVRKTFARLVEHIAGTVYDWGVWLYRLSDRIEGHSDETESDVASWISPTTVTTSNSGAYTITWSSNS